MKALDEILQHKQQEIEALRRQDRRDDYFLQKLLKKGKSSNKHRFRDALAADGLKIIAEVKRRSPSMGEIAAIAEPITLAKSYREGGAAAISVLTDEHGFHGSLVDLVDVARALPDTPVLRKDFLLHPLQLAEAAQAGAAAVLLIVAILRQKTEEMIQIAERLGMDALVEVHDERELAIAIEANASIIGVNNRNLGNFTVDLATAERLFSRIPPGVTSVAESGIASPQDALRMREIGYDAVLIGTALVQSPDPREFLMAIEGK